MEFFDFKWEILVSDENQNFWVKRRAYLLRKIKLIGFNTQYAKINISKLRVSSPSLAKVTNSNAMKKLHGMYWILHILTLYFTKKLGEVYLVELFVPGRKEKWLFFDLFHNFLCQDSWCNPINGLTDIIFIIRYTFYPYDF